ncbi:unnamed protein product, partial [Rotaria magnacalcarata]
MQDVFTGKPRYICQTEIHDKKIQSVKHAVKNPVPQILQFVLTASFDQSNEAVSRWVNSTCQFICEHLTKDLNKTNLAEFMQLSGKRVL